LDFRGYYLLRGGGEPAIRPCPRTHPLHGAHHIGLLGEKGVTKVGSPPDIVAKKPERIGKRDQRLDARVPILLLGRVQQWRATKITVLLKPLLRFDDLQWIRARGQYSAQQWIGIERDGRDQVVQLFRRQQWPSLLNIRRSGRRTRRGLPKTD
jgi:hypothetical protein